MNSPPDSKYGDTGLFRKCLFREPLPHPGPQLCRGEETDIPQ